MLRGRELSWRRCFLIALCCQAFFIFTWVTSNLGSRRHEPEMGIMLLYFLVPLVAAMVWMSWKVFFIAVAVPIVLVVGETLFYLIQLKLLGA